MADLFDDMEEEAEELNGADEDEDEDEGDEDEGDDGEDVDDEASEEPEERPMKTVGGVPAGAIVPQSKQGVFSDRQSIFDSNHDRKVDRRNPVITRAEETANELLPMHRPVSTKAQLVAVFDAQGRPFVAYHQNGRALERFRLPTPQEFEVLRARGQIVKGGLGEASAPAAGAPAAAPSAPSAAGGMNKTWLYVGAAAVGVGALAWWYMQKQKKAPRKNAPRKNDDVDAGDYDGDAGADD
jgi:hypothetical protein